MITASFSSTNLINFLFSLSCSEFLYLSLCASCNCSLSCSTASSYYLNLSILFCKNMFYSLILASSYSCSLTVINNFCFKLSFILLICSIYPLNCSGPDYKIECLCFYSASSSYSNRSRTYTNSLLYLSFVLAIY